MVLPQERERINSLKRTFRHEGDRLVESRRPQPLFMEYGAFYEYPDGSGYEVRFTKCGICVLMKKLGLYDHPALCRLDYTMSERAARLTLCGSTLSPPAAHTATAYIKKRGS